MSDPFEKCPYCGGTVGIHDLDCQVLVEQAELLKDTDWGRGMLAIQRFLRGETQTLEVEKQK